MKQRIQELEDENNRLRKKTRSLEDYCLFKKFGDEAYPKVNAKVCFSSADWYPVLRTIRKVCFPRSKRHKSRGGYDGKFPEPAVLRPDEMTDEQLDKYWLVCSQILDVLENHADLVE